MKSFFISVITGFSALMLVAASYVSAPNLSAPDTKYGVVDLSWAVEAIPGNASSIVILNGTVQEVYQQLNDTNPDYMSLLNEYWVSHASMVSLDAQRFKGSMNDRPDCGYCQICTKRWAPAGLGTTLDVVNALNTLKGKPFISPGPGFCGRISCLSGSQVWWCNDTDEQINLDSWREIANAVQDITRQCFWYEKENQHTYPVTGGQIFEPDGWNVVVKSEGDKC